MDICVSSLFTMITVIVIKKSKLIVFYINNGI